MLQLGRRRGWVGRRQGRLCFCRHLLPINTSGSPCITLGTLQHTAMLCNTMQYTAAHCNYTAALTSRDTLSASLLYCCERMSGFRIASPTEYSCSTLDEVFRFGQHLNPCRRLYLSYSLDHFMSPSHSCMLHAPYTNIRSLSHAHHYAISYKHLLSA